MTALALTTLARPAFAQQAEAAAVDVTVVGTRTPERVQRATIRTGVVTRDEAERRGARNVGEALAGETSLQVNPEAYGYLGRPSGVQMQGLDAERVLILEDGERVTGDVGGVVDLAQLPLTDVERIEYVMGPTSSLYGTNALGGVVNVVTRAPRRPGPSGRARLEARSRGDLLAEASAAYRQEGQYANLDVSAQHTPSAPIRAGRPDTLVPRIDSRLVGLRLGTALTRSIQLRLKLRWVHDELLGLTSEQVPGLGVYLVDSPDVTDRLTARVQETIRFGRLGQLELSLARSRFSGESRRDRRDSPLDETRSRKLDTQALEGLLTLNDGPSRTWVLGARSEAERFTQDLTRTELVDGALRTSTAPEVADAQLASGALFGQLAWQLAEKLTLLPGVRGERHARYGNILAPRLALAYRPTEAWSLRTAFGRGFRAPSAKEFGFIFDHSAIGYRVLGNSALSPERSWGLNGDVGYAKGAAFSLRAGGFINWVTDLIGTELSAQQATPGITDYTYVNVARAKTAGADAQLRIRPWSKLGFDAGYAYLWTRDESTGGPLPSRPPHTVTLSLVFSPTERLEASSRLRVVSASFVDDGVRSPGFSALDVRVGYRFWRDLQVYAGALNLLDEKKEPQRLGDARPALGRSFYLGARGELPGESEESHATN
jgi:outer membrane receptor for ferrienterochelin and colicins